MPHQTIQLLGPGVFLAELLLAQLCKIQTLHIPQPEFHETLVATNTLEQARH